MIFRPIVLTLGVFVATGSARDASGPRSVPEDGRTQRADQIAVLTRIVDPLLAAASQGRLKEALPRLGNDRDPFAPLEALARTLAGIAPWLELGPGEDDEGRLRAKYIAEANAALRQAVDPQSPGYLNFSRGSQPLVDTAFLAQALLRAPKQVWGNLDATTRAQLVDALKSSRAIKPPPTNWELFSAMVEAALLEFTGECEPVRIEKAVEDHLAWYKGDGTYGDGTEYHWDYYNSYVIHPMLVEVLTVCAAKGHPLGGKLALAQARLQRYAQVQERMISPEGTFPVIGRSAAYRFGAFQALALVALRHQLPASLPPGGVRAALSAVIHRMAVAPGTFDAAGWLTIGVVGNQPALGEHYINRGSIYLCTEAFLPLGLPANDSFWTEPSEPWTQQRIWSGENVPADKAIKN